jgi:hypothetical protein
MFNEFRKANINSELKTLTGLLAKEITNLKELEAADIPLEIKREKIEEIRSTINTISNQIDKLKIEIKLETGFKNN